MFFPDLRLKRATRARGRALALLLLAGSLLSAPTAIASEASGEEIQPSGPGAALLERYSAEGLSDAVLLRPDEPGGAIRSIELTDDGEVLVNGKEFDRDELEGFLGEDGRLLAELAAMEPDEIRASLGLATGADRFDADREDDETVLELPAHGGRIRIHGSGDDRVSMARSIRLEEGESARDLVCIGCSIEVDGEAYGSAVAVGGSIRVSGTVHREAVAVGGSVHVEDGGEVGEDAVAVGGAVHVEPGGSTGGQRTSIGFGDALFSGWGGDWGFPVHVFGGFGELVAAVFRTGVLALLGVLVLLVARGAVDNGVRRISGEPWKALFAGLLVQLFFLPILVVVTIVLAVSVIGIPLLVLVPVALLAFVVASLFGFVAVGRMVGAWAERRFGVRFSSDILAVVVGIVLIQATSLIGRVISLPDVLWLGFAGFAIVALGFFLKYVAWTLGMGSMTLVAFGRDWRRPAPEPEPERGPAARELPEEGSSEPGDDWAEEREREP